MSTFVSVILLIVFLVCLAGMVVSSLRTPGTTLTFPIGIFSVLRGRKNPDRSPQAPQHLQVNQPPASRGVHTTVGDDNSNRQAPGARAGSGGMTYRQMLQERSRQIKQDDGT